MKPWKSPRSYAEPENPREAEMRIKRDDHNFGLWARVKLMNLSVCWQIRTIGLVLKMITRLRDSDISSNCYKNDKGGRKI